MPARGPGKLNNHIGHRMKCVLQDARTFVGYFKAYDKHMNLILVDCDEYRRVRRKKGGTAQSVEEKRTLGMVLLRGEHLVSMALDGPPPQNQKSGPFSAASRGPGAGRPAGRGITSGFNVSGPPPGSMAPRPAWNNGPPQMRGPPPGMRGGGQPGYGRGGYY